MKPRLPLAPPTQIILVILLVALPCISLHTAEDAARRAEVLKAIEQADAEIAKAPESSPGYVRRARLRLALGEDAAAIPDLDKAIDLGEKDLSLLSWRADANLRIGNVESAIADYDALIESDPAIAPRLWQRGIALYYAGEYAEGAAQFTSHRTVNPNDVENAVWRLLCQVRTPGGSFEAARSDLIPIEGDTRVPMMEIYALYRGELKTDDIFAAAKAGSPGPEELSNSLFYAHYYIGLYHEARGEEESARLHLMQAVNDFKQTHFMGKLAEVHVKARGWK